MTTKNHDILVVGMDLGGLVAAALLVKRGRSVLVADISGGRLLFETAQPTLAPSRNLLPGLGPGGPLADVFQELSVPIIRRRTFTPADPAFQVVMPGHRIDISADRSELLARVAAEFPGDAAALGEWFLAADEVERRVLRVLHDPGLFPAPRCFGGRKEPAAVLSLAEGLSDAERRPFGEALRGLALPARNFLSACVGFLSRFTGAEQPGFLARFHLGQTRESLHRHADGVAGLTDLLKEKVASLRGGFCQAEGIESLSLRKKPTVRLRFRGLPGDYHGQFLIWNTAPALAEPWLPGRVRRSMRTRLAMGGGPAPAVVTLPVRLRTAGLPVGMLDDCVLVPDPARPAEGENLLAVAVPAGARNQEIAALEVSLCIPDPSAWNAARARDVARGIVAALHDPIPFLDDFLVDVGVEESVESLQRSLRERQIPRAGLPLGGGAAHVTTVHPSVFFAGREALPGLGLIGEIVTGKACADLVSQRY